MDDPFLFSQETDYANLLSVKLYEYSRADFDRCSVNTYAFNRIFAVFSSEGAGSTVGSPMFGGELPMEDVSANPDNPEQDQEVPDIQISFRRDTPKVGRNEPCPCGSGKKYKNCCGK